MSMMARLALKEKQDEEERRSRKDLTAMFWNKDGKLAVKPRVSATSLIRMASGI
jgi:hypothetical protein